MGPKARAYVGSVLVGGAALGVLALPGVIHTQAQWLVVVILIVLATAAQLFKAEAPNHVLFYASPVFFFAGVILLVHPFLLVLLVTVPHLVEWGKERWQHSPHLRAWYLQPFNMAMYTIAGMSARWIYTVLPAHAPPGWHTALLALAMALAALSYVILNHLVLGLALVLARGVSWRDSGVLAASSLVTELVLLCVGIVVAALWPLEPWLIVPALTPLVLMYQALMIPKLKQEAQIDAKTGLPNARHFATLAAAELDRAARFNRPLTLIMADLDRFKAINDTYGHLAGDTVLAGLGRLIHATVRDYDIAGRFGGEEFVIALPEITPEAARALAERLRRAVEAARFPVAASPTPLQVTISVGMASFPADGASLTELTQAADVAVYRAKTQGRNRVVGAGDVPAELRAAGRPPAPPAAAGADTAGPCTAPDTEAALPAETPPAMDGEGTDHRVGQTAGRGATRTTSPADASSTRALHWLFVGGVVAAGVGMTLLGVWQGHAAEPGVMGLLVVLAALAEVLQVDLYGRGTISISLGVTFAAAVLAGIEGVAAVSATIAVVHHLRQGRLHHHLHRAAFNWATHVLAGTAPVLLIHSQGLAPHVLNLLRLTVPTLVAAGAYYVVETGLIATAVSQQNGTSVMRTWRTHFGWLAGSYLVLCVLGLILSIDYTEWGLLGVAVFTVPLAMMYRVQKQYVTQTTKGVQALQRLDQQLAHAGLIDSLTDLGNHRAFQQDLHRETTRAARSQGPLTLARINIDEFKAINDEQGQQHGDRVLAGLAVLLRAGRSADRAFRLSGDDFALLLSQTTQDEAMGVAERVRQATQGHLGGVTISIGVATFGGGENDADLLAAEAAAALQEAKRRGRNRVVAYAEVQNSVALTSSAQAQAVRRLLLERRVSVALQPIWDLEGSRILAYEALSRLGANYGLCGPQEAFDIAERMGRAHDLDAVCREAILARAAELPADALLFMNVSPQTLDHNLLAGTTLVEAVVAAGLTPERVVLELTERSMARLDVVVQEATRLRSLGFKLALDDAGAGNAGLEVLSQLPVDYLKVDRSVVANALEKRSARAVLAGIIAIARETNAYVIAEGIETTALLALVRHLGHLDSAVGCSVHGVQGYLLGRPDVRLPVTTTLDQHKAVLTHVA